MELLNKANRHSWMSVFCRCVSLVAFIVVAITHFDEPWLGFLVSITVLGLSYAEDFRISADKLLKEYEESNSEPEHESPRQNKGRQ